MRIGTNHGSLSDRIMSRYGDTPQGMVESAIEFIKICEELEFGNLVLSMKASNTKIMIEAYRLLVHRMIKAGMDYPLHVGVTEAGSGDEGRIKSAAGIGALLEDGIGDTIRVSLTELPESEIPVAKILVNRYSNRHYDGHAEEIEESPVNPFEYHKHYTNEILKIGKDNPPIVISTANTDEYEHKADFVFLNDTSFSEIIKNKFSIIDVSDWKKSNEKCFPFHTIESYFHSRKKSQELNFVLTSYSSLSPNIIEKINNDKTIVLVIESINHNAAAELRKIFFDLINAHCKCPVVIKRKYSEITAEEFRVYAATDIGLLMADGLGDGIWLEADNLKTEIIEKTSFDILQATGARIYKTEYISCPTCGRTSYNILDTLERIKQFTGHLKGLKIAIMGCVVNGPGEMADADYGYVGSMPGKINLYKGKCLVRRNIDEEEALDVLIDLIKENGEWVEEE